MQLGRLRQLGRIALLGVIGLTGIIGLLSVTGCAPYRVGPQALYRMDIRTVYVPMFESDSLRRHLGPWLTEAVVKQIEMQTPYKVVHTPTADSVLTGRLLSDAKRVLTEDPNDNPRDIGLSFVVQVTWFSRSGELLMQHRMDVSTHFLPESGQSLTSAQQELVEQLAREIVGRMEVVNW